MEQCRRLLPSDRQSLDALLAYSSETTLFIQSNLMKAGLDYDGQPYEGEYYGFFRNQKLVAMLVLYWNSKLMGYAFDTDDFKILCQYFIDFSSRPLDGVIGGTDQVQALREFLPIQGDYQHDHVEGLYLLELQNLQLCEVQLREAMIESKVGINILPVRDIDDKILYQWMHAYNVDALGAPPGPELDKAVESDVGRMNEGHYRWGLTVDDQPVALAGFNAELPLVVQIGPVWTPPEHRGQGYARILIARMLRQAIAKGVEKAILFTDVPAAIRVYESLGFKKIGSFSLCLLAELEVLKRGSSC